MFPDYYKTLGLQSTAKKEYIKKAYRKLVLEFHPDRNKSPNAHEKFIEINEAYLLLYDDEARQKYDREYNYHFSQHKEQEGANYVHSKEMYERTQNNNKKTE